MPTITLHYAISKRTPPSPRTLKAILELQEEANVRLTWNHERLSLTPVGQVTRPPMIFPLIRFAPQAAGASFEPRDLGPRIVEGSVVGSTNVRQNLWNAHLVVSFLKFVSARFPELLIELRDDGSGFVLPGSVWFRSGKPEVNRDWLNAQRERALAATGDTEAGLPFLWAETQALQGNFFQDGDATDFADATEIEELEFSWERLRSLSLGTLADAVIARVCLPEARATA